MSADAARDVHLEIGHVLFMDVVGYSKLLLDEQRELQEELTQIVRNTEQVRAAEAAGKLIRVPAGDGMALVFFNSPEAPVQCAIEISKALKTQSHIHLRMGIHSGPVNEVRDVNDRKNVAGAGINIAQRVMDCGDAGHILLSRRVAEDLDQYRQWQPCLHDLGECEVKHSVRVHVVNLYTEELGNPEVPEKFRQAKEKEPMVPATAASDAKPARRPRALIAALVIAAAAAVGFYIFSHRSSPTSSEKSIAVLPFENLSSDKENAYFADGIQDEILTRLSKIADLKVISRTSTQKYKSAPNNLRDIAQQLGVTNVLEGSVQKAADQVRISVQLINALNDSHIWAESYDRKLVDVFQVESDVAQKIAGSLEAKLTGQEKSGISSAATKNPEAYEAYLRGVVVYREGNYDSLYRSLTNFAEAVRLDPNFALAWALLARMQSNAYTQREATEARAEAARTALETALRLEPDLPEAQMAEGFYEEWVVQDYEKARVKFEQLHSRWRNNDEIAEALGIIAERRGRWQDARAYLDEAIALNPRDPDPRKEAARIRLATRDFQAALQVLDKALSIWPDITDLIAIKAEVYQGMGELDQAEALLSRLHPRAKDQSAVLTVWYQAILRRQYPEAIAFVHSVLDPANSLPPWYHSIGLVALGDLQRLSGDAVGASGSYKQSVREIEEQLKEQRPASLPHSMSALAQARAGLNDREAALQAIDRAVKLAPISKDARSNFFEEIRARIQARFGDKEHAIQALEHLLAISYFGAYGPPLTPALLRIDPNFDEIRTDSRFQELCKDKQP